MRAEQLALADLVNFRIMTFIDFPFDPIIFYNMSKDELVGGLAPDERLENSVGKTESKKVRCGHDAMSISIFPRRKAVLHQQDTRWVRHRS